MKQTIKPLIFLAVLTIFNNNNAESIKDQISENDLHFKDQKYFIKKDYIIRETFVTCDDRNNRDGCQDEVYEAAFNLAIKNNCKTIADIGCGSGFKLLKYFKNFQTIGFDIEPNISFVKYNYPDRQWYFSDLKTYKNLPKFDILICSDVVEHLLDPDQLLNWINKLDFKYLVISTPSRDLLPNIQNSKQCLSGPPMNLCHIREWNFSEFYEYISKYFNVVTHFHAKREWWDQIIIATKK